MKVLVVGGTSGLGKDLSEYFKADPIGRSNGYELPTMSDVIVDMSLGYDVVINTVSDSNQNEIAKSMYEEHVNKQLSTYFITVGSMTWRIENPEEGKRRLFSWAETLITRKTNVKHTLLNPAWMYNTKEAGLFDSISKDDIINLVEFLISTKDLSSKIHMIEIQGNPK